MKRIFCLVVVFMLGSVSAFRVPVEARDIEERDLGGFFEGFRGAFLMFDASRDTFIRYNREQCAKRLSPCSTFKIPNSLIGLETGVIRDEDHLLKWDGTKHSIEAWNRDHTLQSAISNSVVWYYREVASRVGEERMKTYVRAVRYGNENIAGGITKFWLSDSLGISAEEQVDFLSRLYRNDLPFSRRSMDITRKIIRLDETDRYIFRGKTGSGMIRQPDGKMESVLGWFVGWVERKDRDGVYVFAVNIEGEDGANGKKAREIAEALLRETGAL